MSTHGHAHKIAHGVGSGVKWTIRILALVVPLVIVITIIAVGNAGKKSEQSAKQVTPAKYALIHQGMTTSEVRSVLGNPQTTSAQQTAGVTTTYWYYGMLSSKGTYQARLIFSRSFSWFHPL